MDVIRLLRKNSHRSIARGEVPDAHARVLSQLVSITGRCLITFHTTVMSDHC